MVISRWMENDTLKGFLLADTSYQLHLVPLDLIRRNGYVVPYLNAQYDAQYQTLVGTNGASLSDYPAINKDYILLKGNGIIVISTVVDAKSKKPLGVVAFNGIGTRFNLSYKKLNELLRKHPACNFKMVVDKQYGAIAVKKDGSYFDTVEIEKPKAVKKEDIPVNISSPGAIPVLGVYSMDAMKTNEFSQSCQEKLVLTMLNMSKLTPYYYTVLQAIPRKPAPIGTMGVTEDTLYYDPQFVAQLRVPELTFVLIHEIMHIAMQHSVRFGNRTSHHIWNIAADLYINSIICNDFKVVFGKGAVDYGQQGSIKTPDFGVYIETIGEKIDLQIDTPETIYDRLMKENNNGIPQTGGSGSQSQQGQGQSGQPQKGQQGGQQGQQGQGQQSGMQSGAQMVADGIKQLQEGAKRAQQQCGNRNGSQEAGNQISQGLQEIQNAAKAAQSGQPNAVNQAQQGLQDTQNGVNAMNNAMNNTMQSGQQNQGQQGQGGMTPQEQMQRGLNQIQQGMASMLQQGQQGQGQGQQGQGQPGQGQPGQGAGRSGGSNQSQQVADKSQGQGQGSQDQQSSLAQDDFSGDAEYSPMQEVNVVYNGKKLTGTVMRDIMSKSDSKKKDDVQAKLDASRKAIQTIATKLKLEEEERGESLEKNAGLGGHLTSRYIEVGLSAGVDWRVIFRNICKDKPKKTFTLAQPNQDYMNMGMTLADRRRIGKPEHVSHVKFAVDVSGSVSQKELMVTLSEINNIFNYFKLDGELIYWSTMVGDAGMFSSLKDMLKVNPETTGGTDVRCVFDYLAGKTKVHGKPEKDRVRDMKAIFIITDGCFSMNFEDYAEAFGRRVVWLITGVRGNTITFNPPFGRVLALDIDND